MSPKIITVLECGHYESLSIPFHFIPFQCILFDFILLQCANFLTSRVLNKEFNREYVNRKAFLSRPDFACSSYKNARGVLFSTCFASLRYVFRYSTAWEKHGGIAERLKSTILQRLYCTGYHRESNGARTSQSLLRTGEWVYRKIME